MGKQTRSNMPLDESKLSFKIPRTDQPREKIVKLGRMITDRVPAKLGGVTGNDPEYWGLAGLVTDEMADVALKMGVRKPKTFVQLQKLTGLETEKLEKLLADKTTKRNILWASNAYRALGPQYDCNEDIRSYAEQKLSRMMGI